MSRRPLGDHGPHDPVCFGGAGKRTRAELEAYARALAASLPVASKGARVMLACEDRYHFSAALLAVWLRGHTATLPPNGQPEAMRALREQAGILELLHDRDDGEGLDVRALEPNEASVTSNTLQFDQPEPALIVYTSGSTGEPTPHAKSMAQLLAEPSMWIERFELGRRQVVSAVPPHHIYGLLFGVLAPLLGGGSMSRRTPVMPGDILRELADANASVLVAVPPQLRALAAYDAAPLPALERVFSSAAPLPDATDAALAARGLRATQVLGSTETGGIGLRKSCSETWRALPGVSLEVDAEGGLRVRSAWASASPESVRTADRVALREGGFVHLGRVDGVVKVGGKRVDLRELEKRLGGLSGVTDVRVFQAPVPSPRGVELWAVVECEKPSEWSAEKLKQALAPYLDPVVIPRRFRLVPSLPRGSAGKVSRADLIALFETWQIAVEELPGGLFRVPITADLGYFRGHFRDQPILAGVVQIQRIALRQAQKRWPDLGAVERVTRAKFKRLVTPGDVLILSLARKGEHQVTFQLTTEALNGAEGEPASSGVLHFRKRVGRASEGSS